MTQPANSERPKIQRWNIDRDGSCIEDISGYWVRFTDVRDLQSYATSKETEVQALKADRELFAFGEVTQAGFDCLAEVDAPNEYFSGHSMPNVRDYILALKGELKQALEDHDLRENWFNETNEKYEADLKALKAKQAVAIEALEEIAAPMDCGCSGPGHGCGQDSPIVESLQDIARRQLTALRTEGKVDHGRN